MRKPRFMDNPFKNTWRLVGNVLLCFVLAFFFIYALNKYSERSGSIVHLVEPAASVAFSKEKRDGLNVMRIPLNAPISYNLVWYYIEGGCDTRLSLEYEQMDKSISPRAKIILDMKGRSLAVGSPGSDSITRPQPPGITPGLWKYTSTLYAVCANGRKPPPEKLVEFYLDIFDPNQPAVLVSHFLFETPRVTADGYLRWRYDIQRQIEGPSTVIFTLIAKDIGKSKAGQDDVIILQRPAAFTKNGVYPNTDVVFDLPHDIRPGQWTLQVTVVTNLPSGRIQTDVLFDADFEVLQS